MTESIVSVSRQFFAEILLPILRRDFPAETAATAFGVFGYGSEVMGMDDAYSSDHHWGIRINAVMPDALYQGRGAPSPRRCCRTCRRAIRAMTCAPAFPAARGCRSPGWRAT
jgi:hypothetical protein